MDGLKRQSEETSYKVTNAEDWVVMAIAFIALGIPIYLLVVGMSPEEAKDWLLPISSFFGISATTFGIWISLKEYRLKLRAETRLARSTQAETDVRLLQLFTELLRIASGRMGEAIYSKEILDMLIQKDILTEDDFKNLDLLKDKVSKVAMIAQIPGIESANAAFASIATLAIQHDVLRRPAIEALETCREWNAQLSEKYLKAIHDSTMGESKTK